MEPNSSGAFSSWDSNGVAPAILRLLPWTHHPPSLVLVPGCGNGAEVQALHARGYRVTGLDRQPSGPGIECGDFLESNFHQQFDLICERGLYANLRPDLRPRYVEAAARALRSGGQLFGVLVEGPSGNRPPYGTNAAEVLRMFAPYFDVVRLEPGAFRIAEMPQLEAIFVRR